MKKVLSFVLVLAMILGSVGMAFAADFTDQASITNTEASKVLAAAGIIEGYTDGSFKPAGILTRAEGAAIAARMLLGKAEAAKLTTVVGPFNDVPATHWAAGYISYCVSQGLLNGYGNGNFGPDDTLTVAQFGKMMLTALGYKSENEGFIGDAWETNVGSVMVKAGLTDGVTLSGSNAASREVAAQVALNTLKGELVKYDGNPVSVSAGNVTVTTGQSAAKAADWASGDKGYDGIGNYKTEGRQTAGGAVAANVRFMNRYQKDLEYKAVTEDFLRPTAYKWSYKGEKAYTKADKSKLVASYTTAQTYKTLYTLLDDHDAVNNDYTITINQNGVATNTAIFGPVVVSTSAIKNLGWKSNTSNLAGTGNGTQVEVYIDSSAKTVTIVTYDYYLVQADADYNASKKSVKVSPVDNSVLALTTANRELSSKDFAVEDVKADDYLIVTVANGVVKTIAPATKVTGSVDTYTKETDITVDGTKYKKSVTNGKTDFAPSIGSTLTLVLDPNNFMMFHTDEVSSSQYVYIREVANANGLGSNVVADAYFTDGTSKEISLKNLNGKEIPNAAGVTSGLWYNYSVRTDGKYNLKTIAIGVGKNEQKTALGAVQAGKTVFNAGVFHGSNNTVFIVKDSSATKLYTGYKTVPGTTGVTPASIAAVQDGTSGFAKYVFIDAKAQGASMVGAGTSDYVLIYAAAKKSSETVSGNDDTVKVYSYAFLNGTQQEIKFDSSLNFANAAGHAIGIYYQLGYDADGNIDTVGNSLTTIAGIAPSAVGEAAEFVAVSDVQTAATAGAVVIAYKSGVLSLGNGNYELADNVAAYLIDGTDVDPISDVSKLKGAMDDNTPYVVFMVYNNATATDKKVTTIYVVK